MPMLTSISISSAQKNNKGGNEVSNLVGGTQPPHTTSGSVQPSRLSEPRSEALRSQGRQLLTACRKCPNLRSTSSAFRQARGPGGVSALTAAPGKIAARRRGDCPKSPSCYGQEQDCNRLAEMNRELRSLFVRSRTVFFYCFLRRVKIGYLSILSGSTFWASQRQTEDLTQWLRS